MSRIGIGFLLALPALSSQAQTQRTSVAIDKKDRLTFERVPFSATGKTFKYVANKQPNGTKTLIAINGKPVFGTDGELPKYTLNKASVLFKRHSYLLPVSGMYNPWFGQKLDKQFVQLKKAGDTLTIQAVFSDGAGSYLAEWKIDGDSAKRTLLTADDAVVTGFFQSNPGGE
ncbi:hypothetical protein [Hymenobacter rubidus]|uniref:hypothetical protein n=1 Tax=Hymenobacter rubidus TaxID=1441626 RepID=UPI00191DD98A|nr:hypothetical protein [Hymenobacter rubidus]